ncbi:MAG: prolyl oligopeptidase family serine peptidase, partial [Candidatus Dormibacteraeota bacterium]|nr:prolyl oligopeptidase family serine peptidase [Candidatus Dormibacteraeota bacterium]
LGCGTLGPSVPRAGRRFFTRRTGAMDQAALYVSEEGRDRVLLDPAELTGDATGALDWYFPSEDGELVAAGVSTGGEERSLLHLVRTADGKVLEDRIPNCQWGCVEFEPGGSSILYAVFPTGEFYGQHVRRHVFGRAAVEDQVVFRPEDRTESPEPFSVSADGRWLVVNVSRGADESSLWLSEAGGPFREVFRGEGEAIRAWFTGGRLVGLTNVAAPNWRFVEIDPARPSSADWSDLVAETEHVLLDVESSSDRLLVHHLVDACSWVSVHNLGGQFEGIVDLPPLATVTGLGAHPSATDVFLTVETFTRPAFVISVDPATGRFTALGGLEAPTGFDPAAFPVRQVRFKSADGTPSVMFLVGRQEGDGPTVLTGYGGFNVPTTPLWTPTAVPFLEAGGLLAVAVLRGGGEYGEAWHQAGMLAVKQNVFDDFAAAAEALQAHGHCTPATLGIRGRSNGGLLVGAAMTQRPELFGAVVCQVPLLDMVRYERFRIAEFWNREYGSAANPDAFRWLHAYSPYHRVRRDVAYPPLLLLTGEDDARVDPSHAYKFAALLQATHPDSVTLLRVEERAGHGQGKPVTKLVPEEADVWAFLLEQLR